jgi:DNA polymerase III delta prime subunit
MNDIWVDKYRPTSLSHICGNKKATNEIIYWLKNFKKYKRKYSKIKNNFPDLNKRVVRIKRQKENIYSNILITGNHGVGKTVLVNIILKTLKYDIQLLNFSNISTKNNIKKNIKTIIHNCNILTSIKNEKKKKFVLVIDEIETITSTADKNCIISLQKDNEVNWHFPIIFISNNKHNKLLSDIKKSSLEIRIWPPFESDLKKILIKIVKGENIKISSESVVSSIINHCQNDIRRLIYILQDLYYAYGNKMIDNNVMNSFYSLSKKKDIDIDLFNATKNLLFDYNTVDKCLKLYETEKVLLPLMLHQNYIKHINKTYKSKKNQFDVISKISNSLIKGDITENYIYGDQSWDMKDVHGFYTCVYTSFIFKNKLKKKISVNKADLTFTSDLNKTSIKKINKKNINNANKFFQNMQVIDYIFINKLIKSYIDEGRIKECVNFFKGYGIKIEHIESILKIDKIYTTKNNLKSKDRKEFMKHL